MVDGNPPVGGLKGNLKSSTWFISSSERSCPGSWVIGCWILRDLIPICVGKVLLFDDECCSMTGLEMDRMLVWSWLLVQLGMPEAPEFVLGVMLKEGLLNRSCCCSADTALFWLAAGAEPVHS
jgi:hypothetical protein